MAELDALSDGFTAILKKSQETAEPAYQKMQAAEEDYAKTKGELGVRAAELKAKSARGSAGGQLAVYDKYEKELMAPAPTIQYSAETADGMKNLAMLLPIAGMMMGGAGQLSGVGALKAMSGVLEGHKQGNQDRIALEQKNFEQQMQNWKLHQEQIKGAFERALQRAKINASAAQSGLQVDLAKLDAQLLLADVKKNGIIDPLKRFNAMNEKVTTAIEGAVAKMYTAPTARASAVNQQIQRRLATATTQAVEAFKAITDMPPEATTGIIPFLGSKEGVINYIKSATGRALSSDEANVLNTYFKGVGRNLATIEASGVATGLVGLSSSFESLAPMSGDSDYAVAAKLAEGRAVIENGIRVALTDPSVTPEQKALLEDNLKGIQEAIPYTRRDLNQALKAKSEVEGTLGTSTAGVAKPDANLPKPTTDAEFNALPKGSRYIDPDDGKIYVK